MYHPQLYNRIAKCLKYVKKKKKSQSDLTASYRVASGHQDN